MEVFFSWIINHTNRRYTLLGALSAEQEMQVVNFVKQEQKRGHEITRLSFEQNISLNTQLNALEDITSDYVFVPANDVVDNKEFINIL